MELKISEKRLEEIIKDRYDDSGAVRLAPEVLGFLLMKVHQIKELLGHTQWSSTFRYIHGEITELPEYEYLKEILKDRIIRED